MQLIKNYIKKEKKDFNIHICLEILWPMEYLYKYVKEYLGIKSTTRLNRDLIKLAESSVSDTCVVTMQDVYGLGKEARINTPSTLGDNWKWRLLPKYMEGDLRKESADFLNNMVRIYNKSTIIVWIFEYNKIK